MSGADAAAIMGGVAAMGGTAAQLSQSPPPQVGSPGSPGGMPMPSPQFSQPQMSQPSQVQLPMPEMPAPMGIPQVQQPPSLTELLMALNGGQR